MFQAGLYKIHVMDCFIVDMILVQVNVMNTM